jgi:hypothetical protein
MKTTETGSKPINMTMSNAPSIIPRVRNANERLVAQTLWRALWLNYRSHQCKTKLIEVCNLFIATHPKKRQTILTTARHFNIIMELHYDFDSSLYDDALICSLENEAQISLLTNNNIVVDTILDY